RTGVMFAKLQDMAEKRGLLGSFVIDSHGNYKGSNTNFKYSAAMKPSASDFEWARTHPSAITYGDRKNGIMYGLIRISILNDAYLLVARPIDAEVYSFYHASTMAAASTIVSGRTFPRFSSISLRSISLCRSSSCWPRSGWVFGRRIAWSGRSPA